MPESELTNLQREVARLRSGHRRLRLALSTATLAGIALVAVEAARVVATPADDGILHVRGLVVTDQNGTERLRLGAPLPDPIVSGVRRKRSGAVAGMTILDAKGNERGGFVTADQSGEGLSGARLRESEQQVLFSGQSERWRQFRPVRFEGR